MQRLLHAALLCGLALQRATTADATVLHAFEGSGGVLPRDRDLADLVAIQSLGSRADRHWPRDDQFLFSLDHDTEQASTIVRVGGRGRERSDGITITRAIRREDKSDSSDDTGTVIFSPPELDVGWVESCSPTMHTILAESRSPRALRIDDVRFESDAFMLASDPRGVELAPGESVKISVLFVVGEPQPFHSFVFLVTSLGEFALPVRGHTKLSPYGLSGLRVTVPVGARIEHTIQLRNPSSDGLLRVSEIFSLDGVGNVLYPATHAHSTVRLPAQLDDDPANSPVVDNAWELPPQSTKPVARFAFDADDAEGRYHSAVRVATSTAQFLIPIEITVRKNQFVVEPTDIDIGVFTSDREQRHVLLTYHNTGSEPVVIREIRMATSSGLDNAADILPPGEMPVVPPLSRVQHALQVVLQDGEAYHPGRRNMQIEIKTSDGSTHRVRITGIAMRGHVSYSLAETTFRAVAPHESEAVREEEHGVVEMGASISRALNLRNEFDDVLNLERVTFPQSCGDFEVEAFGVRTTSPSAAFPEIRFTVRPHTEWPLATRVCSLQVETNASVHYIPIVLYSGRLLVTSSRTVSEQTLPFDSCGSEAPLSEQGETSGDQELLPRRGSKLCRRVTVEMGKVATLTTLDDVVNITNVSPIGGQTRVIMKNVHPMNMDQPLEVDTVMSTFADPHVPLEIAILGTAWERTRRDDNNVSSTERLLAPGRTLSLGMQIKIQTEQYGVFVEPLATIETDVETIQLCVRFETTPGTIAPELNVIDVAYIHPGQIGYVDLAFTSTMDHYVASRGLELSRTDGRDLPSPFGVWQAPTVFTANATAHIKVFYFPPEFYADCQRGRFYADCFVVKRSRRSAPGTEFSGYGSFVTKHDIERLRVREQEWRGQDSGEKVAVMATLVTEAVRAIPIRLSAYLTRPQFFHAGGSEQTVAFPLTETFQQLAAYIMITNPSDYAMELELAIADQDRELFYACDDDMDENECLREWQDIASDHVATTRQSRLPAGANDGVAPLFFKPRVIRMVGRDQIRVGPIYFFPSRVGSWRTHVYVRNDLTHIEAITVTASSGLGELSVAMLESQCIDAKTEERQSSPVANNTIHFVFDHIPGAEVFGTTRTKTLQLTNSGSYELRCSVRLTHGEAYDAFRMSADRGTMTHDDANGSQSLTDVVLAPGETLLLGVEFTSDCFRQKLSGDLHVVTREGTTQYHIVGTVTPRAAFQCRQQLFSAGVLRLLRHLWVVVVSMAGLTVAVALWQMIARGRVIRRLPQEEPQTPSTSGRDAATANEEAEEASELEALARSLSCLEETFSATPSSAVSPQVAALLEARGNRQEGRRSHRGVSHRGAGKIHADILHTGSERKPKTLRDDGDDGKRGARGDHDTAAVVVSPLLISSDQQQQQDATEDGEPVVTESPASDGETTECKTKETAEPSLREDTASEEEEEEGSTDNQVDNETDGTSTRNTPEQDENDEDDGEPEGELLVTNCDDPFVTLSDFRLDESRQEPTDEIPHHLGFEDDWSALSFELLQNEIGKLVADDRTRIEPASPPAFFNSMEPVGMAQDDSVGGALTALSIAPPPLPMSSLFASSGSGLPLPLPRRQSAIRAAPPGFTAADANPVASHKAFQRFQHHQPADSSTASASPSLLGFLGPGQRSGRAMEAAFSTPYSLFGPALGNSSTPSIPPAVRDPLPVGRIGSRLSGDFISDTAFGMAPAASASPPPPAASTSRLVVLGGEKLSAGAATRSSGVRKVPPP